MRSQLFGQLPQMGTDQMQMLQSLQQMGQKQKEVRKILTSLPYDPLPTGLSAVFCSVKGGAAKKRITYTSFCCFRSKTRC